jgi:D-alanine-D-alanine ligase
LIYGGRSGEHEISLRSANSIRGSLDPSKYEILDYFIDPNGKWNPRPILPEPGANAGIDVAFPVLHGTFGEDGTVQGLLELAQLPYVGAGVTASAVAMDKILTKRLCREAGLPVVEFLVFRRGCFDPETVDLPFDFPVFVKPVNLGSSVGISKVKSKAALAGALREAARYDSTLIVERGIAGREFECAVLGGNPARASIPCEILPSLDFYSYEDKYILDKARIDLPAHLSPEKEDEIRGFAVEAFNTVGCEGMARVDFLLETATDQLFVNEINTIPGFTSISMYPKMWEYSGISYPRLLDTLISLAMQRAETRTHIQYSR